jgi:DNA polymerase I-like protein with 3'-5' exonuclease and polymerase domains
MISVLDIETTFTEDGDSTPYNLSNKLVSVGVNDEYLFFNHDDFTGDIRTSHNAVQSILDKTTLLVGHNLKFDLSWLLECGFKYEGKVWDTMVAESVLFRGQRRPLSLKECCKRRKIGIKYATLENAIDSGIGMDKIPIKDLEMYGRNDVTITKELYLQQDLDFKREANQGLIPTLEMMCEFLITLVEIERNGIYVNPSTLDELKTRLNEEYHSVKKKIDITVQEVMGDAKFNITSGEQLCKIIYSREIIDKNDWAKTFGLGTDANGRKRTPEKYPSNTFRNIVESKTRPVKYCIGTKCKTCDGIGHYRKYKKDGTAYVNLTKCKDCNGEGVFLTETDRIAGFKITPRDQRDVTSLGFKVGMDNLKYIGDRNPGRVREFLDYIIRYKQIEKWLSTFVDKMKEEAYENNILHPKFSQTNVVTGRLSCSDPNFQNIPRGDKLPIKRVIQSRFDNGEIIEMDFAQLEFRVAAFLSQDSQAMQDILEGVDVHQNTANVIGCNRQDAKAHTFKPLYGGMSGTDEEKKYYSYFRKRYKGITSWQETTEDTAIATSFVTLPSGRQYYFEGIKRASWGGSNFYTQVRNYPVQGFATGDIVPAACIDIYKQMKGMKTRLINTVHDSIIIDAHPGEVDSVLKKLKKACDGITQSINKRYNINFNVPLDYEIKKGHNWLDLKRI